VAANRRLAAIMFTDMVGFTASAQTDEAEALRLLREQEKLVRPLLKTHKGREIKSTGDGFLVEFDSALRAVQCGIDIHQHLQERNSKPSCTPIRLRIGVHLGDVEERGNDIFGDSVNIAARIEPLAEPGGICISEPVFGQVQNKIPNKFEKLEPIALKNVRFPIDIYRVVLPWAARERPSPSPGPTGLAVLPFANISPDQKDEYFADGLTEELITVLSHLRELRVIARTSVMQYKSTSKPVSQIGAELDVSSILEGSVRKAGNRLRITAQLIDVASQGHVWADTYIRELDDVFAVQADIARQVAEALRIELRPTEEVHLGARASVRPESYLAYLKGRTFMHDASQASLEAAKEQFELAISLDPQNAAAYSGLADVVRWIGWWFTEWSDTKWEETSRHMVARAIELDPNLAEAHNSLALALWDDNDYAGTEKELQLALSLNPSYSLARNAYAEILQDEGRGDEAVVQFGLAEEADPLWTLNRYHFVVLLLWLGRLDEALTKIQKYGELRPSSPDYHSLMYRYHLARSDLQACSKDYDRYMQLEPESWPKRITLALHHALLGEKEEARSILRHEEAQPESGLRISEIAWGYGLLGDLDDCFRLLQKAVDSGHIAFQLWRLDPRLENVRKDPRFQALLKQMNLA
jgi:adenylate cyclase